MIKLLKHCKSFIFGISEVIQEFKTYKGGKIK
jgi:hypothetical protein